MAGDMNHSLQLSEDQFFPAEAPKTGVCLHHTVGGTASSTVSWWKSNAERVGTAYLIGRDGTIFEVFDPKCWAWQFGLRQPEWSNADRIAFEKRFIGIEIANAGGLFESDGKLYRFDQISEGTRVRRADAFDFGRKYRQTYRYFERYTKAQIDAVVDLVNTLCDRFAIPRAIPQSPLDYFGNKLRDFEGIIGHTMVRRDKSDPIPDLDFYHRVIDGCGLAEVPIGSERPVAVLVDSQMLTEREIEALLDAAALEIDKMHVPSGSMVKALIMELRREGRDTYIRLHDAAPDGHVVGYEFVRGDPRLVVQLGHALGFKEVTEDRLEVHHA